MSKLDIIRAIGWLIVRTDRRDTRSTFLREYLSDALYYQLLYETVVAFKPKVIVEIGTRYGFAAINMAEAAPDSEIYTIDTVYPSGPDSDYMFRYDNIHFIHGIAQCVDYKVPDGIELIFFDSVYEREQVVQHVMTYAPKCKPGAVMFFDGLAEPGMEGFWQAMPDPKILIKGIRGEGAFGAALMEDFMFYEDLY